MTFRPIRCARRKVVAPLRKHRTVIESPHAVPRHAIVLAFEQPDRTGPGEPHPGLRGMSGREEKHMIERKPLSARVVLRQRGVLVFFLWPKFRGSFRFLPRAASIPGSIDGRPQVSGLYGGEERSAAPRILHHMMRLGSEKPRFPKVPLAATGPEAPGALACSQNPSIRPRGGNRLR